MNLSSSQSNPPHTPATGANPATGTSSTHGSLQEKDLEQIVLTYLRKKGLPQTETIFKQESAGRLQGTQSLQDLMGNARTDLSNTGPKSTPAATK
jgi:hypothetical protein